MCLRTERSGVRISPGAPNKKGSPCGALFYFGCLDEEEDCCSKKRVSVLDAAGAPKEVPLGCAPKEVPLGCAPKEVPLGCAPKEVPLGCAPKEVPLGCAPKEVPLGRANFSKLDQAVSASGASCFFL